MDLAECISVLLSSQFFVFATFGFTIMLVPISGFQQHEGKTALLANVCQEHVAAISQTHLQKAIQGVDGFALSPEAWSRLWEHGFFPLRRVVTDDTSAWTSSTLAGL
eukprot:6488237-Amphidinium_carterae.1